MVMDVLVLHPGSMGATVASSIRAAGHQVMWIRQGRSAATVERAEAAGLTAVATLAEAVQTVDVVVSVCPPHAASDVAKEVAMSGFQGTFVDANAVSPATAAVIAAHFDPDLVTFVDGGIIGPPARKPSTTRLYLSGPSCQDLAAALAGGNLEVVALDGPTTAASALKMAYAAWTKGSAALLLATRAFAAAAGVEDDLVDAWQRGGPASRTGQDPAAQSELASRTVSPRAWRFVGEMHEIAASFETHGIPSGFHQAAAELYARLADFKDHQPDDVSAVMHAIVGAGHSSTASNDPAVGA